MLVLVLCATLLLSCDQQSARAETVQVEQADEEILQIAENARRTMHIFFRYLARSDTGADFFIKYPFKADEGQGINMEQIWLANIRFRDGVYYGVLASSPLHVSGMKKGDTTVFDIDAITDWMFVQDGKIAGGRSVKYLLEKVPENQRSNEQQKLLSMFED